MAMNRETIRIIITKALKVSVIIVLFSLSLNAFGQDKLALVIGNQSYKAGPLRNPINDARAMSQMLQSKLGFKVVELHDADLSEMGKHLGQFIDKVKDGGTALVYFAGHGAQFEEKNYLFPINLEADYAEDLPYVALPLQRILDRLNRKNKNGANIILLDACRNNPLMSKDRSYMRGLAEVKLRPNSYIAYATLPNGVASDNPDSNNGLFTQSLLKHLPTEGANLDAVIRSVRNDVHKASGGRQTPYGINLLKKEFCFSSCSTSQPKESKVNQLSQRIAQLEPLAKQGNINAQFQLGIIFSGINGLTYDINKAIFWLSKAATQGSEYAQHSLGMIYYSHTNNVFPGIEPNDELAFHWILKAAQQNLPSSQGVLSAMYAGGIGTPKDPKKSLMWLKQSASNGNATAQMFIGEYFETGEHGFVKDYRQALHWYQLAAKKDYNHAQYLLGELYRVGGYGIKSDFKLSSYWLEKAAFNSHVKAKLLLGTYYCEGLGISKNLKMCSIWISMGFDHPNASEQDRIFAINVWQGHGLGKFHAGLNHSRLERGASNGIVEAQLLLGLNHCKGQGATKNLQKCAIWLSKSYDNSSATQEDKDLAVKYWKEYNLKKHAR